MNADKMSAQAKGAMVRINDAAYVSNKVSLSSTRRLIEEWEGEPEMQKVFEAFLAWREALALFENWQESR